MLTVDTIEDVLTSFLATIDGQATGRVLGMHATMTRLYKSSGTIVDKKEGETIAVDFAGLVALMHPDDQDALHAALAAAIAARP